METLRNFYRLMAPFWGDRRQWRNHVMLLFVLACTLMQIKVGLWIVDWDKRFYDALAALQGQLMPALAAEYVLYLGLMVLYMSCVNWFNKVLIINWREHLTRQIEEEWLHRHRHYLLQVSHEPDNPDQRIAEDVYLLVQKSLQLLRSFLSNIYKLVAYIAILSGLSGVIHLWGYEIHHYLVWVALLYSLITTLLGHWVGHPLHGLNIERQHREADYRATLLRVRDHGEQIAFYGGEQQERRRLGERFAEIRRNWQALLEREFKQEAFWAVYVRVSILIPIFATLPMYLAGRLTFGDMMQTRSAFARVQDGFGWFLDSYRNLIEWSAVISRLHGFRAALAQVPPVPERRPAEVLSLDDVQLHRADGQPLLERLSFQLHAGQWLQLAGPSGIGKSTLLRAIAGLWPYYRGTIGHPAGPVLFLPQQPYLPQDSLRASLHYPSAPGRWDDGELRRVLNLVGLGRLAPELDRSCTWQQVLSGGEQQRLSLARALLQRPALLILDEATNQLDEAAALELMALLRHELPDAALLFISHQSRLAALGAERFPLANFVPGARPLQ